MFKQKYGREICEKYFCIKCMSNTRTQRYEASAVRILGTVMRMFFFFFIKGRISSSLLCPNILSENYSSAAISRYEANVASFTSSIMPYWENVIYAECLLQANMKCDRFIDRTCRTAFIVYSWFEQF